LAQLRFAEENGSDPRLLLDQSLLDGVSRESIRDAARRYLPTDNYVQVTLLPETGGNGS